jgi:hypothetical protein
MLTVHYGDFWVNSPGLLRQELVSNWSLLDVSLSIWFV